MSYDEMAMAKELFSDTHETDARVKYGNATGDATEKDGKWTVPVAIDNEENADAENTKAATYVCDAYIAKGTRVKLVCDPTGRYIVCAWGDAIDGLQEQIDSIDTGVTSAKAGTGIEITGGKPAGDEDDHRHKGDITISNTGVTNINVTSPITISGTTTPTIGHAVLSSAVTDTWNGTSKDFGLTENNSVNLGQPFNIPGFTLNNYGHVTYGVTAQMTINVPNATPKLTLNTDGTADLTIEIS